MDGKTFDTLTRTAANGTTRRGTLVLLAGGALAAGLAKLELAGAKKKGKGKGKNKKCRKLNQSCGGKKRKCCKGLSCTDGVCLKPSPAECDSDNDCGANFTCQNGQCVFEPQCELDPDCPPNFTCKPPGICVLLPGDARR